MTTIYTSIFTIVISFCIIKVIINNLKSKSYPLNLILHFEYFYRKSIIEYLKYKSKENEEKIESVKEKIKNITESNFLDQVSEINEDYEKINIKFVEMKEKYEHHYYELKESHLTQEIELLLKNKNFGLEKIKQFHILKEILKRIEVLDTIVSENILKDIESTYFMYKQQFSKINLI